ncbi:MAG: hypothetical protein Kow0063_06340 [Anaerolineae bacterium]
MSEHSISGVATATFTLDTHHKDGLRLKGSSHHRKDRLVVLARFGECPPAQTAVVVGVAIVPSHKLWYNTLTETMPDNVRVMSQAQSRNRAAEVIMAVKQSVGWPDVYHKLTALETQLQELRQLLWRLKPQETPIVCHHPVKLEGIWADAEITDDDITAAKRSVFSYEHRAFEA